MLDFNNRIICSFYWLLIISILWPRVCQERIISHIVSAINTICSQKFCNSITIGWLFTSMKLNAKKLLLAKQTQSFIYPKSKQINVTVVGFNQNILILCRLGSTCQFPLLWCASGFCLGCSSICAVFFHLWLAFMQIFSWNFTKLSFAATFCRNKNANGWTWTMPSIPMLHEADCGHRGLVQTAVICMSSQLNAECQHRRERSTQVV